MISFASYGKRLSVRSETKAKGAIVNLDPYTFADDLAEDIAADNENEQRTAEEVLLSTIDATADGKLARFATQARKRSVASPIV